MAVTACLYNLCHGDLAVKLHPHTLRDVVNTGNDDKNSKKIWKTDM